jgi:hypothetical protein
MVSSRNLVTSVDQRKIDKRMNILDLTHWKIVRQAMQDLNFPATEESTSYGTPAFKVKKKLLLRLKEDGETIMIHSDDRDVWLEDDPDVFFFTEHYRNYPAVLVRLKKIGKKKLRVLIMQCWKEIAPLKLVDQWKNK